MIRWCRHSGWIVALVVLGLDALTKAEMMALLLEPPRQILVTSFFNLTPVWNHGVSFGMLHHDAPWHRWVLIALTSIISAGVAYWLWLSQSRYEQIALGLILGGAIGNIIDRLRFGAVFDFFDFHLYGYHWPAFNIADACIVSGVALILVSMFLYKRLQQ